ncbi:DUF2515 domain-containing protein [Cytobacillus sp. NCCP-133]|uniref:DUF2515 domain-containing protein n=1 Tax=Cytobacillus sp. NCCP-133 TaxID=766848 RepID=UPI00222F1FB7|nr:DUF2515 domain-containing protein [Cytobacillus sp. NCCP-133]GLB57953.1 hypothetical protein NCCP133_00860 [Cytobacillus sp. NCCP-133]
MFIPGKPILACYANNEQLFIKHIKKMTAKKNMDNISRTDAYFHFYIKHPEIRWTFLASMVSRNAGWNMCDLEGNCFQKLIGKNLRDMLFFTYERANWLIFQDAYPQLLLYHYSTKMNKPMFHLLKKFNVSSFMEQEWLHFWRAGNEKRLMISLIINEQNVIQQPVMEHPVYKNKVFHTMIFAFQDYFHFSSVIFPTCNGELYGTSVNGFRSVSKRIDLGKRLAEILFDQRFYNAIFKFASNTAHTGSRHDYEQYFKKKAPRTTPFLRCTYPIITHHIHQFHDWSANKRIKKKWQIEGISQRHPVHITKWYLHKQKQLEIAAAWLGNLFHSN